MVQVTENWIGKDFLDSFSFTYWGKVTDSLAKDSQGNPIEKTVKITENYLDLNRNNIIDNDPTKADSDTSVIESRYYAYYITGGKLVLERFEGTKDSLFRVSVEERSTVIYNNRAAQKTEYKDPEGQTVISVTYTWKQQGDKDGNNKNFIYTVTETYTPELDGVQGFLLSAEYTRRMTKEETSQYLKGVDVLGAATITETYEADTKTSIRITYRIKGAPQDVRSYLAANNNTLITVSRIWEGDFDLSKDPITIVYTYKLIEDRKLITYTDTFIGKVFDTRQKSYYASVSGVNDGKLVLVTENWSAKDFMESVSYAYWAERDTINGRKTVKVVQEHEAGLTTPTLIKYIYYDRIQKNGVTKLGQFVENRIPYGDSDFIESVQVIYRSAEYVYTKDGRDESVRKAVTIIDIYEGQFSAGSGLTGAFITSTQWDYFVIDEGKVKSATLYFDGSVSEPVSLQYKYKEVGERQGKQRLITVIDNYENGLKISTYKIWKNVEEVKDPLSANGAPQGTRVVTYREEYEPFGESGSADLLVSVERSWKNFDAGLRSIVTYSELYEYGDQNTGIKTIIQRSYKDFQSRNKPITIIDIYDPDIGTVQYTTQAIYYDTVQISSGEWKMVKVVENWLITGGRAYKQSMQYIYRKEEDVIIDPAANTTGKRLALIIETYEGDFSSESGYFLSQIEKDYAILVNGVARRVSAYYDPTLPDMPTSVQVKYRRWNTLRMESVVETYEAGTMVSMQLTWKRVEDNQPDPIHPGTFQGKKVVTRIETWEFGTMVSFQDTWKNKETLEFALPHRTRIDSKYVIVTYTVTRPFGSEEVNPIIERTYNKLEQHDGKPRLVTYIETYEMGFYNAPMTLKKVYYDTKNPGEITANESKLVRVIETYEYGVYGMKKNSDGRFAIDTSDASRATSIQYIYWDKRVTYDSNGTKRIVKVIENINDLEGAMVRDNVQYIYYKNESVSEGKSRVIQVIENHIYFTATESVLDVIQFVHKESIDGKSVTVVRNAYSSGGADGQVYIDSIQHNYSKLEEYRDDQGNTKKRFIQVTENYF
ncbi:MAG: hypothetical protein AABY55_05060, partial [Candidatus Omnitrophota bacterium]